MKKQILIIEDYQPLRDNTADFLALSGFDVITANDGVEGIQKAIANIPDLIVSDIQMPNIDGYEVFSTLKQIPMASDIPFVFLTAKSQLEDFRRGMQMGADDYLTKPFRFDELLQTINVRLEKHAKIMRHNEELLNALIENPITATFIYFNKKFSFINDRFAEITGYSLLDMNKTEFAKIVHPDDKELVVDNMNKCLQGIKDKLLMKAKIFSKTGALVGIELFLNAVKIKGKIGLLGNFINLNPNDELHHSLNQANDFYQLYPEKFEQFIQSIVEQQTNSDATANTKNDFLLLEKNRKSKLKENIKLSNRELEVLKHICEGQTNHQIADKLFISKRTVDGHRASLLEKTNTKNTAELISFVLKHNIIEF